MECSPRNMRTLLIESFKIYIDRIFWNDPPQKNNPQNKTLGVATGTVCQSGVSSYLGILRHQGLWMIFLIGLSGEWQVKLNNQVFVLYINIYIMKITTQYDIGL